MRIMGQFGNQMTRPTDRRVAAIRAPATTCPHRDLYPKRWAPRTLHPAGVGLKSIPGPNGPYTRAPAPRTCPPWLLVPRAQLAFTVVPPPCLAYAGHELSTPSECQLWIAAKPRHVAKRASCSQVCVSLVFLPRARATNYALPSRSRRTSCRMRRCTST